MEGFFDVELGCSQDLLELSCAGVLWALWGVPILSSISLFCKDGVVCEVRVLLSVHLDYEVLVIQELMKFNTSHFLAQQMRRNLQESVGQIKQELLKPGEWRVSRTVIELIIPINHNKRSLTLKLPIVFHPISRPIGINQHQSLIVLFRPEHLEVFGLPSQSLVGVDVERVGGLEDFKCIYVPLPSQVGADNDVGGVIVGSEVVVSVLFEVGDGVTLLDGAEGESESQGEQDKFEHNYYRVVVIRQQV